MPNEVFDDREFQFELANFLSRPNGVDSDSPLPPPAHPQYINALFNGVLKTVGRTVDLLRVTKRVRDHFGPVSTIMGPAKDVWRRSPLWLLIRVTIQISINRSLPTNDSCCSFCAPLQGTNAIQVFPVTSARNSCSAGCWLTDTRSFQSPSGYGVARDLPRYCWRYLFQ
jgi:hypothetical protein